MFNVPNMHTVNYEWCLYMPTLSFLLLKWPLLINIFFSNVVLNGEVQGANSTMAHADDEIRIED